MIKLPELWGVDTVAEWLEAVMFMVAVIAVALFCMLYAAFMSVVYLLRFLFTWNVDYLVDRMPDNHKTD